MSRIGKKLITLPSSVQVVVEGDYQSGQTVKVKGPKGNLMVKLPKGISAELKDQELTFVLKTAETKEGKALWGLSRALVNNAVVGVTDGFIKTLEINGVGFKVAMQGKKLVLNVGFSHPVEYQAVEGVTIETEKNVIKVSGIDRQQVGQTAAEIRDIKKPEPYKGKGIKYTDEVIRRKAGKVVKS
ncbi:MAG: 50S ribosomal protein L6 [Patescibacteria group bacterium]|jgi:large subunit ribosomal protein L6